MKGILRAKRYPKDTEGLITQELERAERTHHYKSVLTYGSHLDHVFFDTEDGVGCHKDKSFKTLE